MCGNNSLTPTSSNWSVILAFNSILYGLMGLFNFFLCMTCIAWPVGYIGVIGHCCGCLAHVAAIIVTGVFRYSDQG